MKPRFSIIMPLYNKAPYVRKALESIVAQSCKDWECIIINDGSTDDSLSVVNEYIEFEIRNHKSSIENIRIISQPNAGVAAARNNGVNQSHGQFLCFLDADDWWEPYFLEEMERMIAAYPEAGLYATNYVYYKPGKTHVALNIATGYFNYAETYLHSDTMPVWTGAACMPRKIFDAMGGFPEGVKLGEDFLLWAKTAIHYPVAFNKEALAYYNNDVPAALRATRNLHELQSHMLFNLQPIEAEIESEVDSEKCKEEWKALLCKLRVNGLMEYWMSPVYHEAAAKELQKVDWTQQSQYSRYQYQMPLWYLRAKHRAFQIGSYIKGKCNIDARQIFVVLNIIRLWPHMLCSVLSRNRMIIRQDVQAYQREYKQGSLLWFLTYNRSFRGVFYYRLGNASSSLIRWLAPPVHELTIPQETPIGEGLLLFHAYNTILNAKRVGNHCRILHMVTLGDKHGLKPTIGNRVTIFSGAVVAGGVTIGDDCIIGPNAVVHKSVPDNCVVVGNPAYILKREGKVVNEKL